MSYSPLLHDPDPDDDRETPYPPAPTPVSRLGRSFRDLGARFLEPLDDYVNRVSGRRKRPLWLGDGGGDGSGSRVGGRSLSFAVTGAVLLLLVLAGWSASLREAEERRQSVLDAMEVFRPYEMPKGRKVELVDRYAGEGFLDAFEFFQEPDPTHGTVTYVDATTASYQNLTSTTPHGSTILSIDSTTRLPLGAPRNSVRLTSKAVVNPGQLIVVDLAHAPVGCAAWPSFWMYGRQTPWPSSGEIDVYEGINFRGRNLYSLHTSAGCSRTSVQQTGESSGPTRDCNADRETGGDSYGCSVRDWEGSMGPGFNAAGGGVFATMISLDGIFIWRWPRAEIPPDVTAGEPVPWSWSPPVASWLGETCNTTQYFNNLSLVFDITTCGEWAGSDNVWLNQNNKKCNSKYSTCDHAVQEPRNFKDAFFDVNYVAVYAL